MATRQLSDRLEKLRKANDQLKREAGVQRIKISESAKGFVGYSPSLTFRLIKFCSETKDPLVPSVWGKLDDRENHYKEKGSKCVML